MGWRGQDNRDQDEEQRWRRLPLRERYAWSRITAVVTALVVGATLVWRASRLVGGECTSLLSGERAYVDSTLLASPVPHRKDGQ